MGATSSTNVTLIVVSSVVPCVLTFLNIILMNRYLDPDATAGNHWFAKLFSVRSY